MLQPDKILYEAEVTATGGRDGKAASDDGLLSVALSLPKSLGGPGGPGTNPEQLFAAASPANAALKSSGRQPIPATCATRPESP